MIRELRRTRFVSLLSVATLVSVLSWTASSLFHNDIDDTICNPVLVAHDHTAHRLVADSGAAPPAPAHCFICHWHSLRTVHSIVQFLAPPAASGTFVSSARFELAAVVVTRQPARAPPLA